MSLINDMLRDLDSRNAANTERSGLASHVRALPGKRQRRLHPALLALCAALLGGAVVWLLLRPNLAASPDAALLETELLPPVVLAPRPQAEPTLSPQTGVESAAEAMPAATPQNASSAESAPASPTSSPSSPSPGRNAALGVAAHTDSLRLDTQIKQPPASAITTSVQETPPAALTRPVTTNVDSAVETRTRTVEVAAAPHISKQPTLSGTAAEQAETEYRRATAALRRGDANEGGEALRSVLRLAPTHTAARQAMLAQLTEQQRWADAENLALDGVGLLPQRSDWALLAARLMYERGDAETALDTLNRHAASARQNADYQILHALLLQRAGRHAEAASCYRTALALRPNEGRWWFGLGRALDADHRETEARQAYEKARDSGNLPPELTLNVERRLR